MRMHVGLRGLVLLALLCGTLARAAEPAAPAAPCTERVADGASAPPPRLPDLSYTCLALRSGQRVLVGEAGARTAQPVLLVHGLGNNAHRDWASAIPVLARQFHVVVLDLPGFGASEAGPQGYSFEGLSAVLAEVLERSAPQQRAHVVGHSLGGAVSLYFAYAQPAKVDRLVLVDAAGILLKSVFAEHIASMRTKPVGIDPVDRFLKGLDERINSFRRDVFTGLDDRFDLSRWLAQNPSVRNALLGRYTQIEAGLGLVEHDFTPAIREMRAPTTVIWGRDDPIAPLRTGKLLAARLPDARLQVIDGAGHTPMQDSPRTFTRLLLDALTAPLPAKYAVDVTLVSQGNVVCRDSAGRRYSGSFDTLTLENCPDARIEAARMKQLVLKDSSATLEDSVIEGGEVALSAQGSQITATNVRLDARVAIRSDNSRLDLAGVSLNASERGVELLSPSRLYFSVSELRAPDYSGDAHFIWPPADKR
ncbi:MAG TPA: alpha/beta hydrolase [Rhizobacter sp.]|nr:alpha/beta hydrolase [Rhizobacter sp.]